MSRHDAAWLQDILDSLEAIDAHLGRGSLSDGLVYDAVRIRLLEIGEAVKSLDPEFLANVPTVPWKEIARMRDQLAHRYFDTDHAIVRDVVDHDLAPLRSAVRSLIEIGNRDDAGS